MEVGANLKLVCYSLPSTRKPRDLHSTWTARCYSRVTFHSVFILSFHSLDVLKSSFGNSLRLKWLIEGEVLSKFSLFLRSSSSSSCWQTRCTLHCPLNSCPQSRRRNAIRDPSLAPWSLSRFRTWRMELHTTGPWKNSSNNYLNLHTHDVAMRVVGLHGVFYYSCCKLFDYCSDFRYRHL